jgi:hypothetical protein
LSDETWVHVTVSKYDEPALLELIDGDDCLTDEQDSVATYQIYEDAAGGHVRAQLKKQGIPYKIHHGPGDRGDYDEGMAVSDSNVERHVMCCEGEPIVTLDKNCQPRTDYVDEVRRYYAFEKLVDNMIALRGDGARKAAMEFFWPNSNWCGYARLFHPPCPNGVGDRLISLLNVGVRESLRSRQSIEALREAIGILSSPWGKKQEICEPTDDAAEAVKLLSAILMDELRHFFRDKDRRDQIDGHDLN